MQGKGCGSVGRAHALHASSWSKVWLLHSFLFFNFKERFLSGRYCESPWGESANIDLDGLHAKAASHVSRSLLTSWDGFSVPHRYLVTRVLGWRVGEAGKKSTFSCSLFIHPVPDHMRFFYKSTDISVQLIGSPHCTVFVRKNQMGL